MRRFKVGDRVVLAQPFRCQGDDADLDQELQGKLEKAFGNLPITGEVLAYTREGWLAVLFDERTEDHGAELFVDENVLECEVPPATEEEVQAAIRSIVGE